MKKYNIAVAGTGYVGMSMATLLSQHNHVTAVDIIPEKVDLINNRKSPIVDAEIEDYLTNKDLDLRATLDAGEAYKDADYVIIATPTNYDANKNFFDTSAVEAVIKLVIEYNPNAIMVIKSTIPVGFTESVRKKYGSDNILFSPEFLRESRALYDNLYPSRIIVGTVMEDERLLEAAKVFAGLLTEGALKKDIDESSEAELAKLETEIKKQLKLDGLFNSEPIKLLNMQDEGIVPEEGAMPTRESMVLPIREDGRNHAIKYEGGVSGEQLEKLGDYSAEKLKESADKILSGTFPKSPIKSPKAQDPKCSYCDYKPVCRFSDYAGKIRNVEKLKTSVAETVKGMVEEVDGVENKVELRDSKFIKN